MFSGYNEQESCMHSPWEYCRIIYHAHMRLNEWRGVGDIDTGTCGLHVGSSFTIVVLRFDMFKFKCQVNTY